MRRSPFRVDLMRWPPFHARLLLAMSPVAQRHGLALAGAHALLAHGLPDQPDLPDRPASVVPAFAIGFVTVLETPLADVGGELVRALLAEGLRASVVEASTRACRLSAEDVTTGERCEITLVRETLREPPVTCDGHPGKVVALPDLAGTRTRDLHERGLPADVKDAAALAGTFSFRELEQLAAARMDGFSARELLMRLEFVELMPDESFEALGADAGRIEEIRTFARTWAEDIKLRRADDGDADYDDPDVPEID